MSTKDRLLRMLEGHRDEYVSGEALAERIGVSRNAVWKAVSALRAEGYRIEAATNRGYRLAQENDLLSPQAIERFLGDGHPFRISVRKIVDSTNAEVRRRALLGDPEGTVVVAEEQTAGRGRRGHAFFSPARSGIYLSILLRPSLDPSRFQLLTTSAAVATARAIERVCGKEARIKWVNDIYVDGRKVAGILTEGAFDMEGGGMEFAALGIGINVKPPERGFPDDIALRAGAVCAADAGAVRCALAAAVLGEFWALYDNLDDPGFFEDYASRCFIIGKHVAIAQGSTRMRAKATGLAPDFKLVVELPGGGVRELACGEVVSFEA